MASGVKTDDFSNYGAASKLSGNLTSNAANIYGGLEPGLAAEAAHPSGYTPTQKALQDTAAQQSAGGATAGAVGQGGLLAARTRNAGAAQGAIGAATRAGGAGLSRAAVGTETNSANLANSNQQRGMSGLEGLNSTELGDGEQALGLSNQALGLANQAKPSFWQTQLMNFASPISSAAGAATGGALFGGG